MSRRLRATASGSMTRIPLAALLCASLLGIVPDRAAAKIDFAQSIQPLLEGTCLECHGTDKQKGRLRLDLKEEAVKKGEAGDIIAPGDATKSELYRRITLPADDEERMPYDGAPLTKAETDVIRDWINEGASWPDGAILRLRPRDNSEAFGLRTPPPLSAAETKALAELEAAKYRVVPIAMNVGWREADWRRLGTNVTDATLGTLGDVTSLLRLNLAGAAATDAGLAHLRGLTNLTRLHLERTRITDAGLTHLQGLTELTYLNLYGTAITDAGLEHVAALKSLRTIYLWDTRTTDAGRRKLQAALPHVRIMSGAAPTAAVSKGAEPPGATKPETR